MFSPILSPYLHQVFEAAMAAASFPPEMLTATIITLLKPGKEPNLPQNFRPISLLNVDVKLYAKMLAHRLRNLLPKLINFNQVGFVLGRQTPDATRRMLNLLHLIEKKGAFSASHVGRREGFRQSTLGVSWQSFGEIWNVWPNTKCNITIILLSFSICFYGRNVF